MFSVSSIFFNDIVCCISAETHPVHDPQIDELLTTPITATINLAKSTTLDLMPTLSNLVNTATDPLTSNAADLAALEVKDNHNKIYRR